MFKSNCLKRFVFIQETFIIEERVRMREDLKRLNSKFAEK